MKQDRFFLQASIALTAKPARFKAVAIINPANRFLDG
ncbi:MAG: hypothetical protein JWQ85_1339 [Mucilaginibacter sp.]|jgi:hypothetical protein|nr:hypothetical protein [Mucilaginibacter sp.]